MKARVTLSLDPATADYLTRSAREQTGGNVSALVERLVRTSVIADAARRCDEYDRDNPDTAGALADWDTMAAAERDRRWSGAEW
ncbi:MAG: hypothetical protein J2P15_17120 [Micromonosporaceae bacterium]|nr:hypothetical protein [Micromonosporaceae bacterium]